MRNNFTTSKGADGNYIEGHAANRARKLMGVS